MTVMKIMFKFINFDANCIELFLPATPLYRLSMFRKFNGII
jgi:hypothetical protein